MLGFDYTATRLPARNGFKRIAAFLAVAMVIMSMACVPSQSALADPDAADEGTTEEGSSAASSKKPLYGDEKIEVDILADKLKAAQAESIMAEVKASATRIHADLLAARIPEQQERSDQAARNLYKIQQNSYDIVEMLLSSQSIDEFILQVDYLHNITQSNILEIKRSNKMKKAAKRDLAKLEESSSSAEDDVKKARAALKAAQDERITRAAEGIATARQQAVTLGGKNSLEKKTVTTKDKNGKKITTTKVSGVEATTQTTYLDDGADWSQSKEEFVAEWSPRIDAYLEGSPLSGQGENFAKSAWKYCIDPRWSAAISNTESSKGAFCIRPHNAWGWGAADSDPYGLAAEWGSWEEAIDAHARGLSEGYGYTITMRGAKTYCPYTWQQWYNNTLRQMAQI